MKNRTLPVLAAIALGAMSACTSGPQDRTELERLEGRVQALQERIDATERALEALQRRDASVASPSDGKGAEVPPDLEKRIEGALAKREERQRLEREAERERQMNEMVARGNQQMVDRLTQSLSLTNDQQVKIKAVIEDMSAKRREVMTRAGEARRNGQEFDLAGEYGKVNTAATDAVRTELTATQVKAFNELVGERGLAALYSAPQRQPGGNNN